MNVQAVLEYDVNVVGVVAIGPVHTALENTTVDEEVAFALGMSIADDVTTNPSGTMTARTFTVSLVQPTALSVNNPQPANFRGTIVSTSPDDNATGTGVQTVTINYDDDLGNPDSLVVNLNGTTPVVLSKADLANITSVVFDAVGAFGTSKGMLTIRGDAVSTQRADGTNEVIPPQIVVTVPAGYYTNNLNADGSELVNLLTGQLQAGMQCPVIAQLPVLT